LNTTFSSENRSTTPSPAEDTLLHPGWIFPATLLAGFTVSGLLAGRILAQTGRRSLGWIMGSLTALLGLPVLVFTIYWRTEWYWISLLLAAVHLCGAIGLYAFTIKPYKRLRSSFPLRPQQRGGYRQVLTGIIGGGFIGLLCGSFAAISYLLLSDYLFSTLAPVTFEDLATLLKGLLVLFFLTLSGLIAGGIMGRFKPALPINRIIPFGFILIWTNLIWLLAAEALINIPSFQAAPATGVYWPSMFIPMLIGCCWSVLLFFFIIQPEKHLLKVKRLLLIIGIHTATAFILSVTFGYQIDMLLAAGRLLERSAYTYKALWCYEQALAKRPDEKAASYLQYRAALLYHKLGREEQALRGFRRVVAKYTANPEWVKKSNRFFDNLERNRGRRRVVLSGVETRTEYKGGYCVPNSLALVMRYWGSDVTARDIGRQITTLGSGTYTIDQKWFAEQQNFRHEFLPLATAEDIKTCIDAGFPVLVYVPAHAFVIMGYDETLETFVTYDVATEDIWSEHLQKEFIKAWKKEGATLILAYPPEKEDRIPAALRERLLRLSPLYLHFQLYAFEQAHDPEAVAHLERALDEKGEYFQPATVLCVRFPWLTREVLARTSAHNMKEAMKNYFWNDFDESVNSYASGDPEEDVPPDRTLQYGLQYLIGQREFDLLEELVTHIDAEGRISGRTLAKLAMVDLALGRIPKGFERLQRSEKYETAFYLGLIGLRTDRQQAAVRDLTKTVGEQLPDYEDEAPYRSHPSSSNDNHFFDEKQTMDLDDYGFPQMAVANSILAQKTDLGENKEDLEKLWEQWSHYLPFDTEVNTALARIMENRLSKVNREKDPALFQKLENKLRLIKGRAARYGRLRLSGGKP
jgi:MFS family permease